jgi:hypothetical protein
MRCKAQSGWRLGDWVIALVCVTSLLAGWLQARPVSPGVPEESKSNPTLEPAESMLPADVRDGLYRDELGKLADGVDMTAIAASHELIEGYFAGDGAGRKQAVAALKQSKIDANILGRITRIRLHWPEPAAGVYYINRKHGPYDLRYFLGVPQGYTRARAWPIVVKLASAEPFLTRPPPDAAKTAELYTSWIQHDLAAHPDALVLMPLLNLDAMYGPSYGGMNSVLRPIFDAADLVNIDPARVDLIGQGLGATGTWMMALNYPTYFAAIAPLAGSADADWLRLRLANLRDVPVLMWADAKDTIIKPGTSRGPANALKALGYTVNYRETRTFGHYPPDDIVDERMLALRRPVRLLYPDHVTLASNRPDAPLNRNDWIQLWQVADPGDESQVVFKHIAGKMTLYEHTAHIDAHLDQNVFDLTVSHVESMRIYLNDQMIDFRRPITVRANKKRSMQKTVKPSIEVMLNDQLFLGRGWRYFTAFIDIDLVDPATSQPATRQSAGRSAAQ